MLLGLGSIFAELAAVSYNAVLRQVSTPATVGRVSAFGWAMGYFGGIVLLLVVYLGFIAGDGPVRGCSTSRRPTGWNIRLVALVAAGVVRGVRRACAGRRARGTAGPRLSPPRGVGGRLPRAAARPAHALRVDRNTVWFLGASALFRDGLAGVFTFGAVLAVTVYGLGAARVLVFGVVANVVSAVGALTAGRVDDRAGPEGRDRRVAGGMLVCATVLLFVSGPAAFWVFGLGLCLFVGPAQSSSRTFLCRLAPPGHEGELFGLYATTGRAVSFVAPMLVGACTWLLARTGPGSSASCGARRRAGGAVAGAPAGGPRGVDVAERERG